jgi:hypothetical protein
MPLERASDSFAILLTLTGYLQLLLHLSLLPITPPRFSMLSIIYPEVGGKKKFL